MSARDELALDIFLADNSNIPEGELRQDWADAPDQHRPYAQNIADGLTAKGYSKPRTITTVDELDALEVESIVRDVDGLPKEKQNGTGGDTFWSAPGHRKRYGVGDIYLPATVLYEPEAEATR